MWGLFAVFDKQAASSDTPRSPLAAPQGTPPPAPTFSTNEPGNLHSFRESEDKVLSTYDWIDKDEGVVRSRSIARKTSCSSGDCRHGARKPEARRRGNDGYVRRRS